MAAFNLNDLASKNPTSAALVRYLSTRQRHRDETNLDILEKGLRRTGEVIVHNDMIEFFKELDKAGKGRLVQGRGDNASVRFEWASHLKALAEKEKTQPSTSTQAAAPQASTEGQPKKSKGGRKKGSKNKPKSNVVPMVAKEGESKEASGNTDPSGRVPTEKQLAARAKFSQMAKERAALRREGKLPAPVRRKKQRRGRKPKMVAQAQEGSNHHLTEILAGLAAATAALATLAPKLMKK